MKRRQASVNFALRIVSRWAGECQWGFTLCIAHTSNAALGNRPTLTWSGTNFKNKLQYSQCKSVFFTGSKYFPCVPHTIKVAEDPKHTVYQEGFVHLKRCSTWHKSDTPYWISPYYRKRTQTTYMWLSRHFVAHFTNKHYNSHKKYDESL